MFDIRTRTPIVRAWAEESDRMSREAPRIRLPPDIQPRLKEEVLDLICLRGPNQFRSWDIPVPLWHKAAAVGLLEIRHHGAVEEWTKDMDRQRLVEILRLEIPTLIQEIGYVADSRATGDAIRGRFYELRPHDFLRALNGVSVTLYILGDRDKTYASNLSLNLALHELAISLKRKVTYEEWQAKKAAFAAAWEKLL